MEFPKTHYEKFMAPAAPYAERSKIQIMGMTALAGSFAEGVVNAMLTTARHPRTTAPMLSAMHKAALEVVLDEAERHTAYAEIVRRERFHELMTGLTALSRALGHEISSGELISHVQTQWQATCYERAGKRTYVVSDGLAVDLALTELRGIRGADLHLPYPSIFVQIPEVLGFYIDNPQTGRHRVSGAYITEDRSDSARWTEETLAKPVNEVPPDGGRSWRVLCVAEPNENSVDGLDDAIEFFAIPLSPDDAPLDDTLKETFKNFAMKSSVDGGAYKGGEVPSSWLPIFRWLMNVVFYTTSASAEREHVRANAVADRLWRKAQRAPKNTRQRKKLVEEYRKHDPRERIVLGSGIRVNRAHAAYLEATAGGERDVLKRRTLVPGHFQRYHVGPREDSTVVWKRKEPYERNAESELEASNVHVLGGSR